METKKRKELTLLFTLVQKEFFSLPQLQHVSNITPSYRRAGWEHRRACSQPLHAMNLREMKKGEELISIKGLLGGGGRCARDSDENDFS